MTKSAIAAARKRPSPDEESERFKQAARDLDCDEDEARWDEQLKKVVTQKPAQDKPE